jgi:hypothetical protein
VAIQNRNILGPASPFDDGQKAATYTPGGDNSLDAPHASGPVGVTDQSSAEFAPRAAQNEAQFRQAQHLACGVTNAGAPGEQIGRGADRFALSGQIAEADGAGPADVIAPEGNNLGLRASNFTQWDNAAGGQAVG